MPSEGDDLNWAICEELSCKYKHILYATRLPLSWAHFSDVILSVFWIQYEGRHNNNYRIFWCIAHSKVEHAEGQINQQLLLWP